MACLIPHNGWLKFTQAKNAKHKPISLEIPILAELQRIIDATTPLGKDTYLVTAFGRPFSVKGFGNRFRKWCDEAGLPHCSAHGLRKAGSARLAELGASDREIMAITGHQTAKEVDRYTKGARQRKLAASAMEKWKQGQNE
jgi:integrase